MFDKFSLSHAASSRNNTSRRIHPYRLTAQNRIPGLSLFKNVRTPASSKITFLISYLIPLILHDNVLRRFFYKPVTLTALAAALAALGYVATTQGVLEEGRDKRRVYALSLHSGGITVNECTGAHMPPLPVSLSSQ